MAKPAPFFHHRVLTRSSLAIATALVLVLSSMQFSAVASVDSAPKVVLDVENTSQSTYVTDRIRDETVVGDKLFFVRDHAYEMDEFGTAELWVSDGTVAGTRFLVQIQHYDDKSSTSDHFAAVGELLYFFQPYQDDISSDAIRYELWTSDGTSSGTRLVKDIQTLDLEPRSLRGTSTRLFFHLRDVNNSSRKVWTSNGTSAGTVEVPSANLSTVSPLDQRVAVGETFFFRGTDKRLWKTTDGTDAETVLVASTPASGDGVTDIEVVGSWIYYVFNDGTGTDLWRIQRDITGTGSRLIDLGFSPEDLTVAGDLLYFTDGDDELWVTNGTETTEIENFPGSDEISDLTAAGDTLYFVIGDDGDGEKLYMSDGTSVTELYDADEDDNLVNGLTAVEGKIFFGLEENPQTLWTSDGTVAGTLQVEVGIDNDSLTQVDESSIISAGGVLYFMTNKAGASKLWSFNLNTAAPTGGGSYSSPVSSPVLPLAILQTKVFRFADFTSNSSVLSKRARAGMTKAIKKFTAVNSVVCTGYTSGVRSTASQRKLALDRARKACSLVEKLAPDVVVKLKAAPARGTGPKFRAVRVKITGN
jgi:ELWxxDGT repeat protein